MRWPCFKTIRKCSPCKRCTALYSDRRGGIISSLQLTMKGEPFLHVKQYLLDEIPTLDIFGLSSISIGETSMPIERAPILKWFSQLSTAFQMGRSCLGTWLAHDGGHDLTNFDKSFAPACTNSTITTFFALVFWLIHHSKRKTDEVKDSHRF